MTKRPFVRLAPTRGLGEGSLAVASDASQAVKWPVVMLLGAGVGLYFYLRSGGPKPSRANGGGVSDGRLDPR